jgi:hypothetical protein
MKLYDTQTKKIYFGGSIIFCDEKNVCSVYYDVIDNKAVVTSPKETLEMSDSIESLHVQPTIIVSSN